MWNDQIAFKKYLDLFYEKNKDAWLNWLRVSIDS